MALALSRPEAIEQLWIHGNLTYLLRPEQRYFKSQIKHAGVDLVVGNISRRWGKSFSLVTYCIEECLKNPKEHIRYGCAFSTDLEEFILPAFEIILNDCPEYLRPYYHKSKKRWVFRNGSVIKLIGLDRNPNGLRGNAITKIVIDEAGFVSHLKYIYNSVIIPATMKQSGIKLIFISTPPESPEHFFVELISMAKILDSGFYLELTIDDISDLEEDEKNIEEERRLFYVALTRAKEGLYLTSCRTRKTLGKTRECIPSPFIDELPAHTLAVIEETEIDEASGADYFSKMKQIFSR